MTKKKTNEGFVEEVKQVVGDEYIFLEEYKNAKTKILCKHNIEELLFKKLNELKVGEEKWQKIS